MNTYNDATESSEPRLIAAKPTWQDDVVFVCGKCMRKQRAGVDGEGTSLRKWLRKALKRAGLKKRIRVIEVSCFDLCPKDGVALARGRDLGGARKPLRVLRSGDDPQGLLHWLCPRESVEPARPGSGAASEDLA